MGKIVVSEFISLDGVIEAPEKWHFPYVTDDMQADVNAGIDTMDASLFGRVTYEAFAPFWSSLTNNEYGIADKLNSVPKYVVSTTLQNADWQHSTIIRSNVAEELTKIKQASNDEIAVTGSATLVQYLIQNNLVDELRLFVHPIVVGSGKRLFKDGADTRGLKLVNSKTYQGGVMLVTYAPA